MASRIPDVPINVHSQITIRLTADNYLYWRTQVDPILRSNLIYGFVDGSLPCPSEEIDVPIVGDNPASTISNPKFGAWIQQDQAILSAIVSSLTEGTLGLVMNNQSSQEAWENLEASFASQSSTCVMQIRTALSKVKKHDYRNATAYFNRVKSLSDILTTIGQPLHTEEFNSFLVAGLDHDYDALADRVTARSVSDPMPTRDV
jgi:hypothetical protein